MSSGLLRALDARRPVSRSNGVIETGDPVGWVPDDDGRIGIINQIFQIIPHLADPSPISCAPRCHC